MAIKFRGEIYLNRKEAAIYIGSTSGTMSVWDCQKKYNFRPIKINGKVHYPASALDEYLENSLIKFN